MTAAASETHSASLLGESDKADKSAMADELAELRARLAEAEAALAALHRGDADALVGATGVVSLRGAEKPYQTFFDAMNEGGLTLDAEGRVLHCNPRFAAMVGASVDQLRGRPLMERVVPEARYHIAQLLLRDSSCTDEVDLLTVPGEKRPVLLSLTPLVAEGIGERRMTCVVVTDLRERVEAEAALQESAMKYRLLAENAADCIFWMGADGRFKYVSPASYSIYGRAPEEFLADPSLMLRLVYPADRAHYQHEHGDELGEGHCPDARELEYRIIRADGQLRWIGHHCHPMYDVAGRYLGRRGSNRDITERKKIGEELEQHRLHLEELVRERTAEIETLNLHLEQRMIESEAASRAKSDFLSNMSHEIRTPMNAIIGLSHLLMRGKPRPEQRAQLEKVLAAADHLLAIINDILDLSKIEAGKFSLEEIAVSIGGITANVVSMLTERAHAKQLDLYVEPHNVPHSLLGDPTRLQQALLNYAGNAIKFTESGTVTLRTRFADDAEDSVLVRFEVEDTGVGLAPDVAERLFSTFEQADNSITRKHGGTGLGLAITRKLARLMGGDAGVVVLPDAGSIFWFTARLKKGDDAGQLDISGPTTSAEALLLSGYSGKRILLVEDEFINREVTLELLEDVGLSVDIAEDGVEAVELAGSNSYDLILMDMQMPRMDGLEATRRIRRLANGATLPILAMTANAYAEDRARCFESGMNDFVVKPVDPATLFDILLRWLTRSHQ